MNPLYKNVSNEINEYCENSDTQLQLVKKLYSFKVMHPYFEDQRNNALIALEKKNYVEFLSFYNVVTKYYSEHIDSSYSPNFIHPYITTLEKEREDKINSIALYY